MKLLPSKQVQSRYGDFAHLDKEKIDIRASHMVMFMCMQLCPAAFGPCPHPPILFSVHL